MENLKFTNKKVAVLGMGTEGLALVDFLIGRVSQISVLDKLSIEEIEQRLEGNEKDEFSKKIINNQNINKIFGENYLDNLDDFDVIFRSPGISYLNPKIQEAINAGVKVSSQIKLFFELCPCKIIGVTGTKGKGTTSSLIYEIMKRKLETRNSKQFSDFDIRISNLKPKVFLAGNIGYPAIGLIPELKPEDIVILELSSFQLMDLDRSPHIAVITNLTVDHLDYHKDVDEYQKAKFSVLQHQEESDFAVLNLDSTFDLKNINELRSNIKYFSAREEDADSIVLDDKVVLDPLGRNIEICSLKNIQLFGRHNLHNIAAASLAADILGVPIEIIKNVVEKFKGLPHRIENVAEISGVRFINDSYATNPEPTMAAINSFEQQKILILGGSSKNADFSELANKITSSNIKTVLLIGDEAKKIEHALITASYQGKIEKGFHDIDEVAKKALEISKPGDVVILSPACASFGMFKNYKDRGNKFKTAVLKLKS